jgi:hypothetical protein
MKHAYVSLVLPVTTLPDVMTIEALDSALAAATRAHEIVIVAPYGSRGSTIESGGEMSVRGPVSVVTTHLRSTLDGAIVAGLARSVGDFVIEWRGPLHAVDERLIGELLAPTDAGMELVEIVGVERSIASRLFRRTVNVLRPRTAPLRRTIGRVYSRYAVQAMLVQRAVHASSHANPPHAPLSQRLNNGFALLAKGTRFGSIVPLTLAAVSALIAVGAAIYALGFRLLLDETPEGWTTLMILIGFGQAAILTMLGLAWTRLDALTKGLAQNPDVTAAVHVAAPTRSGQPEDGADAAG